MRNTGGAPTWWMFQATNAPTPAMPRPETTAHALAGSEATAAAFSWPAATGAAPGVPPWCGMPGTGARPVAPGRRTSAISTSVLVGSAGS
jgi:hypothetical protein